MRRLVVGPAILALAAATLTGAWADDQDIARKVAERLKQEQKEGNLHGFDINLKVAEGKVTLKGDVSSAEQKDLAVDVTREVDGVEDVIDDLQVKSADESGLAGRSDSTANSGPPRKSLLSGLLSGGPARKSLDDANETAASVPSKAEPSDADLAREIAAELKKEKDAGNLKGFDIDLLVKDGVAVLDGQVSSTEQAQLAARRARGIAGVRDVVNNLVVDENADELAKSSVKRATLGESVPQPTGSAMAEAKAAAGDARQASEDRRIGEEITRRLQEAKQSGQLHGFGISLHVENGHVWMKGRVGSTEQRQTALDLARRTSGVRQVINELSVGESAANIAQNLTSRLQAAEADGSLRGAKLNVKVDGPDVWLTGTVSRSEQEQLAIGLARQVPGVRRVISGVEVQSTTPASPPVLMMPVAQNVPALEPNRSGLPTLPAAAGNAYAAASLSRTAALPQPAAASSLPAASAPSASDGAYAVKPVVTLAEATPAPAPPARPAAAPIVMMDQTPRPLGVPQLANYAGAAAAAPLAVVAGAAGMVPAQLPGPGYAVVPARYDHPSLPGYAWPTYAAYPNYAAVTYPKQYSPSAWPYIGPFYPYPQVPLGWRKVTLKWDDGWWNLDFKAK